MNKTPAPSPTPLPPPRTFENIYRHQEAATPTTLEEPAQKPNRQNELLSFMNTSENAAAAENRGNEVNEMDNEYDNYDPYSNSDDSSSSYEWVYYDVEECKSDCPSSDENDMYANDINQAGDYEYYDEVTASEEENEFGDYGGENGSYQYQDAVAWQNS